MLKRILATSSVLFLAFLILFISINKVCTVRPSFAAASLMKAVLTSTPTPTIVPRPTVAYPMVYPGMLPDQPMYKIKMIRDKIWLILTTDHLKRADLMLLFADKRVGAGKVLIEGNKVPLGISTIMKGEIYLSQAVSEVRTAGKEGKNISQLTERLKNASLKHEEILAALLEKVNQDGKSALENQLKDLRNLMEQIKSL